MNNFCKGSFVFIVVAALLIMAFSAFNRPTSVDEEISMENTEGWRSTPEVVLDDGTREIIIEHVVVPSKDETVPEFLDKASRSLLLDKDFVFPVDDVWFDRTLGCIEVVHHGEFKGRKFPELVEICQKVLDENEARRNDHKSEENKQKIKEFLDTFKGIK